MFAEWLGMVMTEAKNMLGIEVKLQTLRPSNIIVLAVIG